MYSRALLERRVEKECRGERRAVFSFVATVYIFKKHTETTMIKEAESGEERRKILNKGTKRNLSRNWNVPLMSHWRVLMDIFYTEHIYFSKTRRKLLYSPLSFFSYWHPCSLFFTTMRRLPMTFRKFYFLILLCFVLFLGHTLRKYGKNVKNKSILTFNGHFEF